MSPASGNTRILSEQKGSLAWSLSFNEVLSVASAGRASLHRTVAIWRFMTRG